MGDELSVNVQALIEFRSRLIRFNEILAEERSVMRSAWSGLHDVWRDHKYDELGESLAVVEAGIDQYLRTKDDYEAHLLRLIERGRAYLDTSL